MATVARAKTSAELDEYDLKHICLEASPSPRGLLSRFNLNRSAS